MTNQEIFDKFKERWPDMFADVVCGFYMPERWIPIVWALCEELECLEIPLVVDQVKSKFGSLRFYYHIDKSICLDDDVRRGLTQVASSLVRMAESATILLEVNISDSTLTVSKKFQGLASYRYAQNPLEEEFAKQWEDQNKGSRPTLAYILSDPPYTQDPLNYPSERDWEVANSVIQWLGTPVGQAFLQNVFASQAGQDSGFCYYTEKRVRREKGVEGEECNNCYGSGAVMTMGETCSVCHGEGWVTGDE